MTTPTTLPFVSIVRVSARKGARLHGVPRGLPARTKCGRSKTTAKAWQVVADVITPTCHSCTVDHA